MSELVYNSGGVLSVYLEDADGQPVVDVAFDSAGLGLWYRKAGGDPVDVELTAVNWIEIGDGHYEVPVGADVADTIGDLHYHCSLTDARHYPGVVPVALPVFGDGDTLRPFTVVDALGEPVSGVYVTCYRVDGARLVYMGRQRSMNDGVTWWMVFVGSTYHYYLEDPTKRVVFTGPEVETA